MPSGVMIVSQCKGRLKMIQKAYGLRNSLAALVLVAAATGVSASDFYIGGSLGTSKVKDYEEIVANCCDDGSIIAASFDDGDSAMRLFAGLPLNPNFSIELGYLDLGQAQTDAVSDGSGFLYAAGAVRHTLEADGFDLSLVGHMPVGTQGKIGARFGFYKWEGEATLSDSTGGISDSEDGNDFFYALNGAYQINPKLSLRGEFAFYALDSDGEDVDVDVMSLSLIYSLGQ